MGAAIAWTLRVTVDAILLYLLAGRSFLKKPAIDMSFILAIIASLIGLLVVSSMADAMSKLWVCLIILAVFAAGSYRYLLSREERVGLMRSFQDLRGQLGKKHA
jgi:hypothetical protein